MKQIRKQKWIVMAITLMMCIAVYGTKGNQTVSAATSGNFEYQEKADGTIEITGYNKNDSNVTIPEKIEGKSVTSIGYGVFYECYSLTSITLPSSLTSIGNYAFYDCTSLKSITLPSSLMSIGNNAFYFCTSLESIALPSNVTSIGDEAFAECSKLKNVTLPSNVVKVLGKDVFARCDNLIFYDVKKNSEFEKYAVQNDCNIAYAKGTTLTDKNAKCKVKVTSAKPNNLTVEYMGTTDKKSKNLYLGSVTINNVTYKMTKIADNALSGNKKIVEVNIGGDITTIGKNAFKNCKKLQFVFCTSKNLKKIGANAFSGDKKLGYIELPTTKLTKSSIGKNAFKGTQKWLQIKVPKKKVSAYKRYFKGKGNKTVWVGYVFN